ncbi:SDR family NAD(P)-dependent oxidoreductase [Streptomyces sulfonofaciens]|nr:SDR family NAD(P)-dependent oxidoreductase [Streptomyces sulfonofaciens]
MGLSGRRALVTGSSRGLGRASARMLAAEGATVVVHGPAPSDAGAVAAEIRAAGGSAETAAGDLTTEEGAAEVAHQALAGGPVDILVNNAGTYDTLPWSEAIPELWAATYETNVVSGVRMIRHLVPGMRERGWGRVIQLGGGLAVQPMAVQPHYSATLAARHNLAVSLARELRGTGVTSNTVAPGAILTEAVRELLVQEAPARGWGDTWEEIERHATETFVPNDTGRFGRPEEIAAAVVFLAGTHAGYISGATLRVDGGTVRCVQ